MATEKRLIDANFLDDRCRRQMADEWNKKVAPVSWSEAYKEFLDDVWDAPIVDAVEVVHGRWVIKKRHTVSRNPYMDDNYHAHATCSECDFCIDSSNGSFGFPKLNTTNYCPNCGAKMDGDGNGT